MCSVLALDEVCDTEPHIKGKMNACGRHHCKRLWWSAITAVITLLLLNRLALPFTVLVLLLGVVMLFILCLCLLYVDAFCFMFMECVVIIS